MTGPGMVILLFGLLLLGGAIIAYTTTGSMASLIAGSAFGLGLLVSALGVLRKRRTGFLGAPLLIVLVTAYFGYRFIENPELIPSGLMVALGLVTFFLYFAVRG